MFSLQSLVSVRIIMCYNYIEVFLGVWTQITSSLLKYHSSTFLFMIKFFVIPPLPQKYLNTYKCVLAGQTGYCDYHYIWEITIGRMVPESKSNR